MKILGIGNSFTDDTFEYLYHIAKSAGVEEVKAGILFIGGCTLDAHYENAVRDRPAYEFRTNTDGTWHTVPEERMKDAIRSDDWDIISFQQASPYAGRIDAYGHLGDLIGYIKNICDKKTKFVFNMTWAYQSGTLNPAFSDYGNDQMKMYNAITDAVQKVVVPHKEIVCISPTGTAIQNARTSYIGDTLARDIYNHLSFGPGRYIAGLTFFKAVTGMDFGDNIYLPVGVDARQKKAALEAAENAVKNPFTVTQSLLTD